MLIVYAGKTSIHNKMIKREVSHIHFHTVGYLGPMGMLGNYPLRAFYDPFAL